MTDDLPENWWGECDRIRRRLRIHSQAPPQVAWETLVHEMWHALNPEQSEDAVDERAAEMAAAIQKYGYRFLRNARAAKST
jgi:hypothetical protein